MSQPVAIKTERSMQHILSLEENRSSYQTLVEQCSQMNEALI